MTELRGPRARVAVGQDRGCGVWVNVEGGQTREDYESHLYVRHERSAAQCTTFEGTRGFPPLSGSIRGGRTSNGDFYSSRRKRRRPTAAGRGRGFVSIGRVSDLPG